LDTSVPWEWQVAVCLHCEPSGISYRKSTSVDWEVKTLKLEMEKPLWPAPQLILGVELPDLEIWPEMHFP
jgi:hypothetical protein